MRIPAPLKILPLGLLLPAAFFTASVAPSDAASNVSKWANFVGFQNLPSWLTARGADHHTFIIALFLALLYTVSLWGIPNVKVALSVRSEDTRKVIALYGMLVCGLGFLAFATAYIWRTNRPEVVSHLPITAQIPQPVPFRSPSPSPSALPVPDPMDPSELGKVFTNKPITYFLNVLATENSIQARSVLDHYMGMLIKFSAVTAANNIQETPQMFVAGMGVDGTNSFVICRFSLSFRNFLARLSDKEKVVISGTLSGTIGANLILDACHPSSG